MMRLILLCFVLSSAALHAGTGSFALVGGTVITVADSQELNDAVVLINDGRIGQIGKRDAIKIPDGYEVIDTQGRWITPGLIDTNVHLILTTIPEFFVKYEDDLEDIAIQSAQVGLKYGMTTMADSWGPLEPLKRARDRINAGEFEGSRVLIAGNIVGLGGPFSAYFMGSWPLHGVTIRYGGWVHPKIQKRINKLWEAGAGPEMLAMTPEEAADAMRAYIAQGVDFVKVAVAGHGIGPVEPLMFSPRVLRAMRDVVTEAGIPFQTHSFSVESLRQSIDLDPEFLQHPNVMSVPWQYASDAQKEATREMIAEIVEKGIISGLMMIPNRDQVNTYAEWDSSKHDDPWINKVMDNRKGAFVDADFKELSSGVKVWLDAGVTFTIATDQGPEAADLGPTIWGRLGRAHFDRMEALQQIGASPMEILTAATRNGAAAYDLEGEIGTIETGKVADLLILEADPLEDIANLRRIQHVIKDGRIIDRESLPTVKVLDYDPEAIWPE
jgi:imidazolonepropionase-like amidohydrolase